MALGVGLTFLKVLLVGRLLSKPDFGTYSFVTTVIQFILPLASFGLLEGMSQRVPWLLGRGDVDGVRALRGTCLGWLSILGAVVLAGSAFVGTTYSEITGLAIIQGLAYLTFSFVVRDIRNHLQTTTYAGLLATKACCDVALTVTVARFGGLRGVLISETCVLAVISAIALWKWTPSLRLSLQFRSAEFQRTIREGLGVAGLGIVANGALLGDRLVLGFVLLTGDFAGYAAHTIVVVAGINVVSIVSQYVLPRFLHLYGSTGEARRVLDDVERLSWRMACAAALGLPAACLLAHQFVSRWYVQYVIDPRLLCVLLIGATIEIVNLFPLGLLAVGRTSSLARIHVWLGLLVLTANCLLLSITQDLLWFGVLFLVGRLAFAVSCAVTSHLVENHALPVEPALKRAA
jgi:O-antigen/teichoic acid export membrane protein